MRVEKIESTSLFEAALDAMRERLDNAEIDSVIELAVEDLKQAVTARVGEVAYSMRGANATEQTLQKHETELHNLSQVLIDLMRYGKDEQVTFYVRDLRQVLGCA